MGHQIEKREINMETEEETETQTKTNTGTERDKERYSVLEQDLPPRVK